MHQNSRQESFDTSAPGSDRLKSSWPIPDQPEGGRKTNKAGWLSLVSSSSFQAEKKRSPLNWYKKVNNLQTQFINKRNHGKRGETDIFGGYSFFSPPLTGVNTHHWKALTVLMTKLCSSLALPKPSTDSYPFITNILRKSERISYERKRGINITGIITIA